jgi:uroporphyrinogen decarboxylase
VPFNYYGNADIDRRLREHFGTDNLQEALDVDFRGVRPKYTGPKLHEDKGDVRVDDWGIHRRWVEHEDGGYWDFCDWPLTTASVEEVMAWPMPGPDDHDYSEISAGCDEIMDYCIMIGGAGWPDVINSTGMLRTMEQVLVDLITQDEAGMALINRKTDIKLEIARRTLEAAEGKIDMMGLGEDLGTQRGPILGLDLFRKAIRPQIQKFVDLAKEFDIPCMIHSCGSSSWAYPDFIEMGIEVVETLQPEAEKMAPEYLKKTFGKDLAFHGCISTAGPLAYGTPEDVKQNVKETLEIMMPGGGYILSPTHSIQDNSPTENVLAMYEAGREFGMY